MFEQLYNAIFIGSIYALFAVGFALVFSVLDILNLAHPTVFMLGAFSFTPEHDVKQPTFVMTVKDKQFVPFQ